MRTSLVARTSSEHLLPIVYHDSDPLNASLIEINLWQPLLLRRCSFPTHVSLNCHSHANSRLLLSSDVRSYNTIFIFGVQHYIPCIQKSRDHADYL